MRVGWGAWWGVQDLAGHDIQQGFEDEGQGELSCGLPGEPMRKTCRSYASKLQAVTHTCPNDF